MSQKQADFVRWYTSPASPTYDNVVQSARRAGFSDSYSKSHAYRKLVPLAEKEVQKVIKDKNITVDRSQFYNELLSDAEKGIAERVRMKAEKDVKLMSIQQKDQHFVAERLGNEKWHTKQKTENTSYTNLLENTLASLADNISSALDHPPKADYIVKPGENEATESTESDENEAV